ncbi:glucuronate isomerase [Psychrosphaera sp. B3R10]|uniref:glucuronate isomerase n=1 Tax=unclassified Psychrosphaera TaxID=2641570 RepID=UPI001C08EFAB|nr:MULTISPECIES: glucuronate isomerase [unclassified Psychrosphaera]MBU2881676.1 glucuronate isomerase [Psychrosphaera sp. I2R16]MBU2991069.1 glucuronate isomerase [Psychrosphaera sp. B3R10]
MSNQRQKLTLHPDRLFSSDDKVIAVARELYTAIKDLPIISPHGHTDPKWFAQNSNFENATDLLIRPDHYVFRMLFSQGVSLESLGIPQQGEKGDLDASRHVDPKATWQLLADNMHLFAGTPSGYWLDDTFANVFGFTEKLCSDNALEYYDEINKQLATPEFTPLALMDRFNIELIATTEGALDQLPHHVALKGTAFESRVITSFRPDDVVDASREDFKQNVQRLAEMTGEDTTLWTGYLAAIRKRRAYFKEHGRATATDHGHPTALTANLSASECQALLDKTLAGEADEGEQELFRAQCLTELAGMSIEDGLVMQIHPGAHRNHNQQLFDRYGRDKGADIPSQTEYVNALKPLLTKFGNNPELNIILFTLDETTYSRELAPLAGHYPSLKLGPAWWFHDSPAGMLRFRQQVTETAGFYNTVGFNDDTRAFLSIPARHDVARRVDCRYLAELVTNHQITIDVAHKLAYELTYGLVKKAYKL